ncbi:probable glycosyltransferase, type 1 [Natronomonas pharaonis DSM 2160]|uniref:Probable glycosyltransferase, type 1 n=1 Tax=Natronomonas pharaonis (strain ATCC 35678 / DSM 2160 / CIP 103997 / JCM 8858 / NBRC 14720 / NCIMB 2260 / Gabara) TaxID=348780 RepID=A0A1U7EVM4_NATPD|nr:glycosyltransferase family 4 protein [Natronomonas pharaonis]CAI49055.1 probable glycosyltransferase, type 1 [Natronomonas pharaonis DSM 2160]
MRVAIILKTFPPDVIGGMETQTKRMATELHHQGHDVTVFTKRFGDHDDSDVPYEVVRIQNWRVNPFVSDLTFLVFAMLALIRRRNEFDVLQCMMLYPVGFLGYVLNRLTGLPYFAWVRGGDYYFMNDVWWKRWMMRRVLDDTLVLAQSGKIRDDVVADFDDIECNIDILGNAVSIPDETASGEGVLYVGRLAPKKGIEYLIDAVAEINASLTIVGDGSERDRLERRAAEAGADVTFEGEVDPDDVGRYYRSAGVFALASTEGEGMPNVVLEAMSWGLPVVATDSGGLPSLIDTGYNGYLVPMRDSQALSAKIERLLADDQHRANLGENARRFVADYHSWEALCSELKTHYERVT